MSGTTAKKRETSWPDTRDYENNEVLESIVDLLDFLAQAESFRYNRATVTGLAGASAPASSAIQLSTGLTYKGHDGVEYALTSDDAWSFTTDLTDLEPGNYNMYLMEATSDSTPAAVREGTQASAIADIVVPAASTANALIASVIIQGATTDGHVWTTDALNVSTSFEISDGPALLLQTILGRIHRVQKAS